MKTRPGTLLRHPEVRAAEWPRASMGDRPNIARHFSRLAIFDHWRLGMTAIDLKREQE